MEFTIHDNNATKKMQIHLSLSFNEMEALKHDMKLAFTKETGMTESLKNRLFEASLNTLADYNVVIE